MKKYRKRKRQYGFTLIAVLLFFLCQCVTVFGAKAITPETIKVNGKPKTHTFQFRSGERFFTIPIHVKNQKQVYCELSISGTKNNIVCQIDTRSENTVPFPETVEDMEGRYAVGKNMKFSLNSSQGSTQYLHIVKNVNEVDKTYTIKLKAYTYKITKSGGSLVSGKWAAGFGDNRPIYYKMKVNTTGSLLFECQGDGIVNLTLMNAKKKPLSNTYTIHSKEKPRISASKGTYYLKVTATSYFKIRYKVTGQKDGKNTSMKNAVPIKKGKLTKGIIMAGSPKTKAKWYKITVPKKGNIKITIKNLGGDRKSVDKAEALLVKDKTVVGYANVYPGEAEAILRKGDISFEPNKKPIYLEKGTYYVCVRKDSKKDSLYYSLKWN